MLQTTTDSMYPENNALCRLTAQLLWVHWEFSPLLTTNSFNSYRVHRKATTEKQIKHQLYHKLPASRICSTRQ